MAKNKKKTSGKKRSAPALTSNQKLGVVCGTAAVLIVIAILVMSMKSSFAPTPEYWADITVQDYGVITVKLEPESAPKTVKNFVSLAESGFYDGLTFHRIQEGFMMQGGSPTGDSTGSSDKKVVGEFAANGYTNPLSHTRGAIAMARANDYNSASCQFFIVQQDCTQLDGQYAVFGYVTEGIEIVDAICADAEPIDAFCSIAPDAQPVITSITITRK